jgi:hypothetical protein
MPELPTPHSTRRDGIPARLIRLADDADWGFATPTTLLVPRFETRSDEFGRSTNCVVVELAFGYPLAICRLIENVRSVCEHGSVLEQYEAFLDLAISLLCRAHNISLTTACGLLTVPTDQLPGLAKEVLAIAFGAEATSDNNLVGDIDP